MDVLRFSKKCWPRWIEERIRSPIHRVFVRAKSLGQLAAERSASETVRGGVAQSAGRLLADPSMERHDRFFKRNAGAPNWGYEPEPQS
jgi:hypothetical protein